MKRIVIWEFLTFAYDLTNGEVVVEVPKNLTFEEIVKILAMRGYTGKWRRLNPY